MPTQILLLGISTIRRPTRLALRIRVSMSAMGSWLFMLDISCSVLSSESLFLSTQHSAPSTFLLAVLRRAEGETETLQQLAALIGAPGGRDDRDVHSLLKRDRRRVHFRENRLLIETEVVVAGLV